MKRLMRFLALAGCLGLLGVQGVLGQNIPGDAPPEVQKEISRLASPKVQERGQAVQALGRMGARAAPAVPALIKALPDRGKVPKKVGTTRATAWTNVGSEAAHALTQIGPPAVPHLIEALKDENWLIQGRALWSLRRITGQDFGKDHQKWRQWWEKQDHP